ncbi:MAG: hypothetical protein GY942_08810, partial [Aestuariibacter sp.]|nr:hypothetical protein [Aestuariibacter sp.]
PIINSGDPGDSAPPGAGGRVDIGHLEQNGASFYADDDYCQTCNNDGLIWQVNAFDKIQDAIDTVEAIQTSLTTGEVVPFTIGVAPGIYDELLTIRSPITLLGSGADQTILQPSSDGGVTFNGATQAGIEGFQIDGTAAANFSTGILVTGNANNITIQRNLIVNWTKSGQAIVFEDRGSGIVKFNTIVNSSLGIQANGDWAVVQATNNIIYHSIVGSFTAMETNGTPIGGIINSDYNLLYRSVFGLYYTRVNQGANDILDVDPQFVDTTDYMIQVTSPAIDAADPGEPVSLGGGLIADIGYHEYEDQTIALSILMGELDASRVTANIGVQAVEYGVVPV